MPLWEGHKYHGVLDQLARLMKGIFYSFIALLDAGISTCLRIKPPHVQHRLEVAEQHHVNVCQRPINVSRHAPVSLRIGRLVRQRSLVPADVSLACQDGDNTAQRTQERRIGPRAQGQG